MAIDIKQLTKKQLEDLEQQLAVRKVEVRKDALTALRSKVNKLIKGSDFSMDEVFPGRGRRGATRHRIPAKFRDPSNAENTWSGRGKRPNWFKAALAKGTKQQDLLI